MPISVDTYKASVADAALAAGASIVNDISGLRYEPALAKVVARRGAAVVLMHTRGRSRDMYRQAVVSTTWSTKCSTNCARAWPSRAGAGMSARAHAHRSGLGFAKEAPHSYEALARLHEFGDLGRPVVVGPSRKAFLAAPSGGRDLPTTARDWATAAAVTAAVLAGAHIVRVHAVAEMAQVVRVADEIRKYHRADAG